MKMMTVSVPRNKSPFSKIAAVNTSAFKACISSEAFSIFCVCLLIICCLKVLVNID